MLLVLCLAFVATNVETLTIKPRSVNLALETVFKFDKRDKSVDLQFIDNVQKILSKVRNAIGDNKIDRRYSNGGEAKLMFSDFIEDLVTTLENYDDEDLEDVSAIISDELRKYHYGNCKFYELLSNVDMRRFVGQKLDLIKRTPADTIKKRLRNVLSLLRASKLDDNFQNFIGYVDSLYTAASSSKLNKFIDDLKLYRRKSKRANLDLIKIIRQGIRSIIFDHYTSLNVNARRDFKLRLETFWKNYMVPVNIKHNDLNFKFTKFYKNNSVSPKKKVNTQDIYSKTYLRALLDSDQKRSFHKITKRIHVIDVTPMRVLESYELATKNDFDGKPLILQNLDNISRNLDDTSEYSTNQDNIKAKKSPKANENDNQDVFDIENEMFINKSVTSNKITYKRKTTVKLLEMNKRERPKSKHNNKKANYYSTTQDFKIKTKHNKIERTKHLKKNKYEISEGDDNATAMEQTLTKTQVTRQTKKSNEFNKTRKAIFLTLYPKDFTVKFTRKRSNNKVTTKKHKKHTNWEEAIARKIPKKIDSEEDKLEEKSNSHQEHDNHVSVKEAPESTETLEDLPIIVEEKFKKHKQYYKHRRPTKYFKSSKRFRKSRASSEEGIIIESFENDQKHLIYRKMSDDLLNTTNPNVKPIKEIEKVIGIQNISKITTESNPKVNEINNNAALEFWEGTKISTSTAKTTITVTKPTTSAATHAENTIFNASSSNIKNNTEFIPELNKPRKTFEIVLRTNDRKEGNTSEKIKISNQNDSIVIPFMNVDDVGSNVTTVKNKLTTITTEKNNLKLVTETTKMKDSNKVGNVNNKTTSITQSLIKKTTNALTNNTGSTLTTTVIKTSPIFSLLNFLNQSKIEFEDNKKKLLQEKIMKDMEVIFASTTQPPVSVPKEATDPFRDIEEALDFV